MSSFNQSSSSSSSRPIETTENSLIDQISGVASGLAQQMNQWAQQTFAQTSAITDQTVGNFFQASQQMMGLAGNMTSQYNNLFAPENQQLVQDANDYASPEHMAVDMGSAGATAAQAGQAGIQNSEENLVGMGIDPSSGRYAALDKASEVANAASIAGAENTQRNTDISTGQQLRAEAVQVGSQLPSAIANTTNTAIQANTGAENATLGNANTGAALNALANQYLGTAMGIKLPPNATVGSSQSTGTSSKPEQTQSGQGNQGGGGGPAPGGGPSSWSGMTPNTAAQGNGGGSGGARQPGSAITQLQNPTGGGAPDWGGQSSAINDIYGSGGVGGVDTSQWTDQSPVYSADANGSGSMGVGQPGSADSGFDFQNEGGFGDSGFGQTLDPTSALGGGQADQTFGNMSGGTDTQYGNISYDPSANQTSDYSGYGDYSQPDTSVYTDPNAGGGSFQDYGYTSPDMSGSSDDSGYAGGGMVAPASTGGPVSPSMSPSGGARTDDVRANLNANEFVVPKDVAKWKGEEFFHNLIAQSRDKRMKMQAALGTGGKPMPAGASAGKPTFNSRPMGAR